MIKFADQPHIAGEFAASLVCQEVLGSRVTAVLVEEKLSIAKEFYASITVDDAVRKPVMMVSTEGGVEVEETAAKSPEKIVKEQVNLWLGLQDYQIRNLTKKMGLTGGQAAATGKILRSLYEIFRDCDALLVEVNPLVLTEDGSIIAADAKMNLDDYALYKHPEFSRKLTERKAMLRGADLREAEASDKGINAYVELDGDIGVLANGASLGMEAIDLISDLGGKPGCFCDLGGIQTVELVQNALELILSNPNIKALLVNVLGGLTRCDVIAEGIVKHVRKKGMIIPLAVRLNGLFEEEGWKILRKRGIEPFDSVFEAAKKAMQLKGS